MKNFLIKVLKFLIIIFLIFLGLSLFIKSQILKEIVPKKEIEEVRKRVEELRKQITLSFPEIGERVEKVPKGGLRANVHFELKTDVENSFSLNTIFKNNELYWRINFPKFKENLKFFSFLFEWRKNRLGEEELQELQKLKEIMQGKEIFEKFERKDGEYEIKINTENLKSGLVEWKRELISPEVENFFKTLGEIKGKIFTDNENFVKRIELENGNNKVVLEIENLDREIFEKKELSLEKLFCSFLKIQ